jgi:HlyD family secretion protein
MKHKIIGLLIILGILGGLVWFFWIKKEESPDNIIKLYGNVDIRQLNLGFRVSGKLQEMIPEEGDPVEANSVIAILDREPYQDEVNQLEAQIEVDQARLNELLAGTRQEEKGQARAIVEEREASLQNTLSILEKYEKGVEAGVVSKQQYDTAKNQKDQAEASLKAAKQSLKQAINGPRIQDIQAARATLKATKARLDKAINNMSYTILEAPSDAVILTRVKEPGAVVMTGETIYTLSINSPKWIQSYIEEEKLGRIAPGMPVEIKTDSYPDKIYKGQVGFISPVAEFTPKSVETEELRTSLVYRVRFVVKDKENELRQGMPVTAYIYPEQQKTKPANTKNNTSRKKQTNDPNTGQSQ